MINIQNSNDSCLGCMSKENVKQFEVGLDISKHSNTIVLCSNCFHVLIAKYREVDEF